MNHFFHSHQGAAEDYDAIEIERLRCALTDIAELRDRDPLDVGFVHTPVRLKEVQARLEEARSIARAVQVVPNAGLRADGPQ